MNSVSIHDTVPKAEKLIDCVDVSDNHSFDPVRLSSVENKPVLLDFEGGSLSSDAGILLLREVEQQIGLISALARVIDDQRDPRYVKHTIEELMLERIAQIACGYEDADDCDELRDDPIFKMFAGRAPESGNALGSQPTMSRLENAVSRRDLYRLATVFIDKFVDSYDKEPKVIILDFDNTEDKVHGGQQLALFNNFFKAYCFMPLHVYEGLSGKLITTVLLPGKRVNGKTMLAIAKRIIKYLRSKWQHTLIIFRGDSHFTYPDVMDWFDEHEKVMFATGIATNSRLKEAVKAHSERALKLYKETQNKVCLYHSFYYKADTWNKHRRIVAKIEATERGLNLRFVVTDMEKARAKSLYTQVYCDRGNAELYIKDHKLYLKSDRTSCHRFTANQFRLFLHSAAYMLIHTLKTNILKNTQWANATFETIRLRLFKIGARVRQLKTRIKVELPSSFPLKKTLVNCFQIFETLATVPIRSG